MPFVSLAVVLILAGIFVYIAIAALLADALLRPPRMNDGKALYLYQRLSPADLGLNYTSEPFLIRDAASPKHSLNIAAWWMPAPTASDRCVILIHGYADAKVASIAWAPLWQSLGFNVLAIDLRAHGDSGGRYCTVGVLEESDLTAVLEQLQDRFPAHSRLMVLFGISMGAGVALRAAQHRDDIVAVVIESPYADFVASARKNAELRAMPSGSCFTLAVSIAQMRAGIDYASVQTPRLLQTTPCPVLWIYGENDKLVDASARLSIQHAISLRGDHRDQVLPIAEADHLVQPDYAAGGIETFIRKVCETSSTARELPTKST